MIIIRTKRLLLRHVEDQDAQFILRLLNSPSWLKYIGDKNVNSLKDALGYIKNLQQSYSRNGFGLYVMDLIKEREAIGICGFVKREFLDHPDLGFAILPDFERNGFTFESATAMLRHGNSSLQLNKILAITTRENFKSVKLLRKLGMEFNNHVKPKNEYQEFLIYGLKERC